MNFDEVEQIIGYVFNDKTLLVRAFTHSSYSYENNTVSNERLEFLGDGLLGFLLAEILYGTQFSEGEMSVMRAGVVSAKSLGDVMDERKLSAYILFGKGERGSVHTGKKVLSDVLESLIGAVYLDGGFAAAKALTVNLLGKAIDNAIKSGGNLRNYKGDLQEYVQKYKLGQIEYTCVSQSGLAHEPIFTVNVTVNGQLLGEGASNKLQKAEMSAAKCALLKLNSNMCN